MTFLRQAVTTLAALFLVGWLPGHGGGSGGVVVLPQAVALAQVDQAPLGTFELDARKDVNLRLSSDLAGATVSMVVDGAALPVIGAISGRTMTVKAAELAELRSAGVREVKYTLVSSRGVGQVLVLRFPASLDDPIFELEVR